MRAPTTRVHTLIRTYEALETMKQFTRSAAPALLKYGLQNTRAPRRGDSEHEHKDPNRNVTQR